MTNILVIWQGRLAGAVAPSTDKMMKTSPNFLKEDKICYKMVYKTLYFGWSIPEKLRNKVKVKKKPKKKALALTGLNKAQSLSLLFANHRCLETLGRLIFLELLRTKNLPGWIFLNFWGKFVKINPHKTTRIIYLKWPKTDFYYFLWLFMSYTRLSV